jgi:hypothetical protein
MHPVRGRQAWWSWVAVPWALLAGLLLAPSPSWAQCGHYVLIGGKPMGEAHAADAPNASGGKAPSGDFSPLLPMSRHTPCSGPGCKQGPATPPLAPVAPPPVVEKEWGHLAGLSFPCGPELPGSLGDSTCPLPFSRAGTIYHPPRFSLS